MLKKKKQLADNIHKVTCIPAQVFALLYLNLPVQSQQELIWLSF